MLLRPGRPRAPDSRRCTSETQCCELRTTTSSTGQRQRAYVRFPRKWRCDCGEIINRDENAALNIRDQAINNLVPTNGKELTLVESGVGKMPRRNENRISERPNFSCGSITLLICAQPCERGVSSLAIRVGTIISVRPSLWGIERLRLRGISQKPCRTLKKNIHRGFLASETRWLPSRIFDYRDNRYMCGPFPGFRFTHHFDLINMEFSRGQMVA
jgi:hypothetical protein